MRLGLVAGEASGDLLAALLMGGIQARWPQADMFGIGGPQMAQHGFDAWWPHDKLSVHGFSWELLRRYREIVGIRAQLGDRLLRTPPDLFIGVDAPDFNLALEARLRLQGVRTMHFVCPSVWAWRPQRVDTLRTSADHVLCIFPFEPALLQAHGIDATYVGHPLANHIPLEPDRAVARRALGLDDEDAVVALLPGSRPGEVRHLAHRFLDAARIIQQTLPATRFVLPCVPGLMPLVQRLAQQRALPHLQIIAGQSHTALAACDATLIASGTATLEAALFKRPMVIAYHMGRLSWQLMRRKRLQPWVGLPNILCERFVVPELLQDAATPQALAREVLVWLDAVRQGSPTIAALQSTFTALHHTLRRDTATLATDAIAKVLQA